MSEHVGWITHIKGRDFLSFTQLNDDRYPEQRLYTEEQLREAVEALRYVRGFIVESDEWHIGGYDTERIDAILEKYREVLE